MLQTPWLRPKQIIVAAERHWITDPLILEKFSGVGFILK
jgi:hypothetical protein